MPSPEFTDRTGFARLLTEARAGSPDALGRVLMECRNYLLLTAGQKLGQDLQGKVSPSDVVQETFLEAQRDFNEFSGDQRNELLAWLGRILFNNLANAGRYYRDTDKRALKREVAWNHMGENGRMASALIQDTPTPSERVAASEEAAAVEHALATLPEHYQQVLQLRYHEQRTFSDIGAALNCSAEAARKLWARAVDQLQKKLSCPHEPR